MNLEIERKFLVNDDSYRYISQHRPDSYIQAYICCDEEKDIRIRIINDKDAYMTIKYATTDNAIRKEFEYPIPLTDALQIIRHCKYIIKKNRYEVLYKGNMWYIDEYVDNCLNGLTIAEIELSDINQPVEFPTWIGLEVTKNKRYSNSMLAQNVYNHKTTL